MNVQASNDDKVWERIVSRTGVRVMVRPLGLHAVLLMLFLLVAVGCRSKSSDSEKAVVALGKEGAVRAVDRRPPTTTSAPGESTAPHGPQGAERTSADEYQDPRQCPPEVDAPAKMPPLAVALADMAGGGPADRARAAAIARCGTCHPREYEAWKTGPHGNAVETVRRATREMYDQAKQYDDESGNVFPRRVCGNCHFPTRHVFDAQLSVDWRPGQAIAFEPLCIRSDEEMITTGVDCLTCHAWGDKVLAFPKKHRDQRLETAPGEGPPCEVVRSETFAHVYACAGCHWDVDTYAAAPAGQEDKYPFVHCDECHMEKDASGRYTHLYHWKENRQRHVLAPAFDRMKVSVEQGSKGKTLHLRWANDFLPHNLLHATPKLYQLVLELRDAAGVVAFSTEIRFFSSHARFHLSPSSVRHNNPTGELLTFKMGETLERSYELPASIAEKGTIQMIVRDKNGHDLSDDFLKLVLEKEISYGAPD